MEYTNIRTAFALASKISMVVLIGVLSFSSNIGLLVNQASAASTGMVEAERIDEEILWFARTVYSETKKPEEQTLVAWVIRNRVESEYYPNTYKEVVLQKGQFSGMHATDKQYHINTTLTFEDSNPTWDSAVSIARAVYSADPILRPIGKGVMHFYSPISMVGSPSWAQGIEPAHTVRDSSTNAVRFAFYSGIVGNR
jgi:hypothetical protein